MSDQKDKDKNKDQREKPATSTNSQPMPEEYSNEANHKGATDLGTEGTKATASQQQGQGAWRAKDTEDNK